MELKFYFTKAFNILKFSANDFSMASLLLFRPDIFR